MSNKLNGWKKVKFGDVVKRIKDQETDRSNWPNDKYIGGQHFGNGDIRVTEFGSIKDDEWVIGSAFRMKFKAGDVLYVSRNPRLRKGGVVDFEGICSDVTYVMRAKEEKLLQSLLPFIIQTEDFVMHTCNNAHGSTNPFLNWKDIAKYEFLLPPIEEQKKIVEVLWSVEDNLRIMFNSYDKIIRFRNKFSKELFFNGSNIINMKSQKFSKLVLEKPRNGIYKTKEYRGRGTKMVNMGEIFKYPFISNQEMERVELDEKEIEREILKEGDLIFARRSLVIEGAGKCSLVLHHQEPLTFESSIIRVRPNKLIVFPKYLFYLFRSKPGRRLIEKIVRVVAVAGITGTDLMKLNIPLPDMPEQLKVVSYLEKVDLKISTTKEYVQTQKNLRNKLSNELLTGKIRLGGKDV